MEILGRDISLKYLLARYCFNGLILLDISLITIALVFQLPNNIMVDIQYFDLFICLMLLGEFAFELYKSSHKMKFISDPLNIIGLIASIPFDFILINAVQGSILLRYLRLLKISRIFLLSTRLVYIKSLCEKTGLHKILAGLLGTALVFTLLFYFFGSSYGGFDDFYFVMVTLTTVEYGDITPVTYNEKVLALILILIGIFVFSTITAAISSFLTDRILNTNEKDIMSEINETIEKKNNILMDELKLVREENNMLKNEIDELKELIKNR